MRPSSARSPYRWQALSFGVHRRATLNTDLSTNPGELRLEEACHLVELLGARHRREAVDENPTVAARTQPLIAEHDHTEVLRIANEPTDALFQRNHCLWHLLFEEWIAAASFDRVEPRFQHRIVGRRERQLVDHHDRQCVALHIDAFPETARAEEY